MIIFFFQAEDGIRYLVRSRGLGDVYKRQQEISAKKGINIDLLLEKILLQAELLELKANPNRRCLLYTSDAADERSSVDLGGRRIIKKKIQRNQRLG